MDIKLFYNNQQSIKLSYGIVESFRKQNFYIATSKLTKLRLNLSRGFSAKYNVFENRVQNIRRADSPQRLRIIGSKVFFYL